ncbi:hypothetical protein Pcinc_038971, partial [Petrolisthes cinctipes]
MGEWKMNVEERKRWEERRGRGGRKEEEKRGRGGRKEEEEVVGREMK